MLKMWIRNLHNNFICPTNKNSKIIVESTKVSYKIFEYLNKKMPIRHNDYLVNVSKIFPFIMHTKIFKDLFGIVLSNEKISKYYIHQDIWNKIDKILESEILQLEHFDLIYRMANPLFCLEEIDSLNYCDVTSTFKYLFNSGHNFIFNISINNDKNLESVKSQDSIKFDEISTNSIFSSNNAAFELLKQDKVQNIAFNLKPITNDYIIDISESKLFNNFPDFGDHNVGIDRQVIIPLNNNQNKNSTSCNKTILGIQLFGGDIVNDENISYISKFCFGPIFIDKIQNNSLASSNNCLFVGDQLIAINQTNIEGISLVLVNNLIEESLNSDLDSICFIVKHNPIEFRVNQYLMQFNNEKYTTFNKAIKYDSTLRPIKKRTLKKMPAKYILPKL